MPRLLVFIVLITLTGLTLGCEGRSSDLPPLEIQAVASTSTTVAPLQETVVTKTVAPTQVVAATTPVVVQKGGSETPTPTQVGKDYAWWRAGLAATGKHPFLTGWLGKCEYLKDYVQGCFFSEQGGLRIEFGYDGIETYYVYYDPLSSRELQLVSWHNIDGSLLFPLKFCPKGGSSQTDVKVRRLTPNGIVDQCDHLP